MERFARKSNWLILTVTLFGLVGLVALYGLVYVPGREDYFSRRNLRLMALTADRLKTTVEGLPRATEMAARSLNRLRHEDVEEEEDRKRWLAKATRLIPTLAFT